MRSVLLAAVAPMLLVLAAPAKAQDWDFRISPYFWAAGITGDLSFGGDLPTVHVEQGFDDIVDDLQFGAMAAGEVWRDRLGLLGDFAFADSGSRQALAGPTVAFAQVDTESFTGSLGVAYRAFWGERYAVDVLGGGRGVWTDTKLTLTFTNGAAVSADQDDSWLDPIFGARGRLDLSERWSLTGYGDLGGGASDHTYQLYAAVHFRVSELLRLSGGYRYYDVKYEDDDTGFLYEIAQEGALLGVSFDF